MRKRLFSILLAQCMVLCLMPTTAFAEDSMEETAVCTCEIACTEETMNTECPVCGAEGALAENCGKYVEPAAEGEASQPEGEKTQEKQDSDMPDTQSEAALAQMSGEGENGIAVQSAGVAIDNTNFPDANFCSFVASSFDEDNDNYLSDTEINAVESINCADKGISDLTGISHFTALETLNCFDNQLTSLDVSKNTALIYLDCYGNQLTSLDVSKNTALTYLDCGRNQLTSLDVSKDTALTELDCRSNQLTKLDVSKNTALTELDCRSNQLTKLDVSKNTVLTTLYCWDNQLTKLDVSKNTALTDLACYNNQLTSLDVSKNTALTYLDCDNNQLTSLDISNTNTDNLTCRDNIYQIVVDNDRTFDLSTLPGNFDVAKTSDWSGGKVSGNTLTVESGKDTVTYKYDCGKGRSVTFTLKFVGLFADYTKVDEAIAKANALNKDDYKDFSAVEAAINAVVRDKSIMEQSEVDKMAKAIEDAIAALVKKPSSSGGSSSGGSSSPSYPVTTPSKTENGTVTVSPRSAEKGDTVTITAKPDSGYQLDDLTVTDKNGNELKLTDKGNGKYTFTMPASKVEIKATFVKKVETSPFSDVSTNAYYYEAVKWAQEKGITGGIGNGLFGPNQPCTRAQIVTFLWRAAGSPEPKAMSSFADVSTDAYYAKAVAWAVENGITTGTGDGKFSPDATCTRAQSVTFLFRAIGKLVDSKAEFSDVLTDSYYANAVAWAVENGVTTGIGDGLFGPDNSCTRAQIVTFLFRAYQGK